MKTLRILSAVVLLAVNTLHAQLVADGATNTLANVTNNITGPVIVGTNGSFTLLTLADNAQINNSGNGTIGRNATAKSNEVRLISSTARWQMGGSLFVGSNGPVNRLVVSNGAVVENVNGNIGFRSTSSDNSALITGAGSRWTNSGSFTVSSSLFGSASNQLVVSDGATLVSAGTATVGGFGNVVRVTGAGSRWDTRADFLFGGSDSRLDFLDGAVLFCTNAIIGDIASGGVNSVLLSGNGTVWTNSGDLTMAFSSGRALVTASNGATLGVNGRISLGALSGANLNSITVTDPGTKCLVGSSFLVGSGSSGNSLVVSNGGIVLSSNAMVGAALGAIGNTALVTGAGSVWSNSSALQIGAADRDNQLVVSNGGWLVSNGGSLGRDNNATSNKVVLTGVGSGWNNLGTLIVGDGGSGNALIATNGATVLSSNVFMGAGTNLGHNNLVLLTGAGTVWSNQNDFVIGNFSDGNRLVITNGAYLENGLGVIGARIGCNSNEVRVAGVGSMWTNWSSVFVGSNGAFNRLIVSDGGQVCSIGGFIGEYIGNFGPTNADNNEAIVTGAGSLWQNTLTGLFVGDSRNTGNRLVVSNGASMFNSHSYIGASSTNNFVLVTGNGSTWSNSSFVAVGQTGRGNKLLITNGASFFATTVELGSGGTANDNLLQVQNGAMRTDPNTFGGKLDVEMGTVLFNSGLMDVGLLRLTNGQGSFQFNGGTLITRGAKINNGLPFVVGQSGSVPAVWDVRADLTNSSPAFFGVTNTFVGGDLIVGSNSPFNQLIITNGALLTNGGVSAYATLGRQTGANSNSVNLAGLSSQWSLSGGVIVGNFGSGNRLVVSNGARMVTGSYSSIGHESLSSDNEAVVTGPGSSWTSGIGDLFVGNLGRNNRLVVSEGGQVACFNGRIGDFFAGTSNNSAIVTGPGSTWSNANQLIVGNSGARNSLVVSNGGTVSAGAAVYIGFAPSATNNRAVVDGGTLRVTNASANGLLEVRRGTNVINAGFVEVDVLRITNTLGRLELNGGTVAAKGSRIHNGVGLRIGNSVSPATFVLAGNGYHYFDTVIVFNNGTLTGNGTVGAPAANAFAVLDGGTLSPGASIGKMIFTNNLTLAGKVFMEISKHGAALTNDQVHALGGLSYGGDLTVTNIGPTPLSSGDKFTLFASPGASAFLSLALPPLAPGLFWTNKLSVDGSIEVFAPPAIPMSSGSYTQSFDSLSMSGGSNPWRDNSTLLGWYAAKTIAPVNITNYISSDGSSTAGALYSFGSTGSPERALGAIGSGGVGTISYGLGFFNDTGVTVSNFNLTFTGEQWRDSSSFNTNTLTFWYRVSSTPITSPEPGIATNWTAVTNLDFASPVVLGGGVPLDGNASSNRQMFSAVILNGLSVPPGQNVFFRWQDLDDTGTDQGMAVDDLIVTFAPLLPKFTSVTLTTNGFPLLFGQGESNLTYRIEAATNLDAPIFWQLIGSNNTDGSGLFQFTDTNAPAAPQRFYRLRWP